MKKVWVLIGTVQYECDVVLGVFATRDLAEKALVEAKNKGYDFLSIEEHEVATSLDLWNSTKKDNKE